MSPPNQRDYLACPKCKGDLDSVQDQSGLLCKACRLVYPIRNGVPVMLIEESSPFQGAVASSHSPREKGGASPSQTGDRCVFLIVEGKNKGEKIELEKGICRAMGRSLAEMDRTKVFNVDSAISLDETSKKIVLQYLTKQFQKKPTTVQKTGTQESLGGFLRGADFQVRDLAVSRLHAMIFYDESGLVGILDLVSKNGTYVNGGEVESKILKKGDLITIGGTKIRFEG